MANVVGDNPNLPRDPDKFDSDTNDAQREFRQRVSSGLANEVFLDVYERPASFEPSVTNLEKRLFDAYAAEVARVTRTATVSSRRRGRHRHGIGRLPGQHPLVPQRRLYSTASPDAGDQRGLLAPRFAPSQRPGFLTGTRVPVSPAVPASTGATLTTAEARHNRAAAARSPARTKRDEAAAASRLRTADSAMPKMLRRTTCYEMAVVALSSVLFARASFAVGPDTDTIAKLTGLQPEVKNGVAKVSVPRTDSRTVDGMKMQPFQGFTSWRPSREWREGGRHGDMTLAEDEVTPAMDAALGTAWKSQHSIIISFDRPRILFMHIGAWGAPTSSPKECEGLRRHQGARKNPTPETASAGQRFPREHHRRAAARSHPRRQAQAKDGMAKFVFAKRRRRTARTRVGDGGQHVGGVCGKSQAAVVDGDFAMLEGDCNRADGLRAAHIDVVAIHTHHDARGAAHTCLHFWARGGRELARGIKAARATQK